jgi:tRNA(Arg) A34 adenosine deaminase TadA
VARGVAVPWALDRAHAEQVAFGLGGGEQDVAFIREEHGLYFARRLAWPPLSPVLRLVCGVHELEPRTARWIVRNPIYSTAAATPTCRGAVRLAAHRLRAGVRPVDHGLRLDATFVDAGAAAPDPRGAAEALVPALQERVDALAPGRDWLQVARALADLVAASAPDAPAGRADRPIAAVLTDASGTLLGWATNTGSRNPTRHAELNLVEDWLARTRQRLPLGARVFASLKPCKMCAAVLWDAALDPLSLRVTYAEDDPGRYARETILDAGSMSRRVAVATAADLHRVLQQQG